VIDVIITDALSRESQSRRVLHMYRAKLKHPQLRPDALMFAMCVVGWPEEVPAWRPPHNRRARRGKA